MELDLKRKIHLIKEVGIYELSDKEYDEECDDLLEECISSYYNQFISEEEYFDCMHLLGFDRMEANGYIESMQTIQTRNLSLFII